MQSEQYLENYQDNVEEFHSRVENLDIIHSSRRPDTDRDNKNSNSKTKHTDAKSQQQDEESNACDESIAWNVHVIDEFQTFDKYKRVPRAFYDVCPNVEVERTRVNMPDFKISRNPFQQQQQQQQQQLPQTPAIFVLTAGANGLNDIAAPLNDFDLDQLAAAAPVLSQMRSTSTAKNNNIYPNDYSYSMNDGDVDNEIINQIAGQIPELLDKSEMREICLTPSLVDGLKQQAGIFEDMSETAKRHTKQIIFNQDIESNSQLVEKVSEAMLRVESPGYAFLSMNRLADEEKSSNVEELVEESYDTAVEEVALPADDHVIFTLVKREFQFHKRLITKEEIHKVIADYVFIQEKDESRANCSHKEGGKECKDKKIKECLRNIGTEVIKQVGRKILSGNFNLTQVSFPIRAMIPLTILEKAFYSTCLFPLYINKAAATTNLVERFKLLICATLGNFYINCGFLKPLNPILGETCRAVYQDGTKLYAEQISHHPPISYFTVYGPQKSYCMYGNYNQEVNAGLNSVKLKNRGSRHIRFSDGQHISYNFAKESYSGSLMGTMKVESKGCITFKDAVNGIVAEVTIDGVKKKPTDYLQGTIKVNGVTVSSIYGTYMGFLEFDGIRYWDYRHIVPFEPIVIKCSLLGSDQSHRLDKKYLLQGDIAAAQRHKENLENIQRTDAKLRKKHLETIKKQNK